MLNKQKGKGEKCRSWASQIPKHLNLYKLRRAPTFLQVNAVWARLQVAFTWQSMQRKRTFQVERRRQKERKKERERERVARKSWRRTWKAVRRHRYGIWTEASFAPLLKFSFYFLCALPFLMPLTISLCYAIQEQPPIMSTSLNQCWKYSRKNKIQQNTGVWLQVATKCWGMHDVADMYFGYYQTKAEEGLKAWLHAVTTLLKNAGSLVYTSSSGVHEFMQKKSNHGKCRKLNYWNL